MIDWIWTQLEAGTLTPEQARELWGLCETPWYRSTEGMIAVVTAIAGLAELRIRGNTKQIHNQRDKRHEQETL